MSEKLSASSESPKPTLKGRHNNALMRGITKGLIAHELGAPTGASIGSARGAVTEAARDLRQIASGGSLPDPIDEAARRSFRPADSSRDRKNPNS